MKKLTALDKLFLRAESNHLKLHVTTLSIFEREGNPVQLAKELSSGLVDRAISIPHYNERLRQVGLSRLNWVREPVSNIDYDFHIQVIELSEGSTELDLRECVSQFHEQALDYDRPLWQMQVIHGFSTNQVAMVVKLHHCCIDGISGFRIFDRAFSTDPEDRTYKPVPVPEKKIKKKNITLKYYSRRLARARSGFILLAKQVIQNNSSMLPLKNTPFTVFNNKVSQYRNFSSADFDLDRIKRISARANVTINDVVSLVIARSLKRYLDGCQGNLESSLNAIMPVSLHAKDDQDFGNKVGNIFYTLASDIDDINSQLKAISESTAKAKLQIKKLPRGLIMSAMALAGFPAAMINILNRFGMSFTPRPFTNLIISNIKGPKNKLYFNGAELKSIYPLSILFDGLALNITVNSYAGRIQMGIVTDKLLAEDIERMAEYMNVELDNLENYLGFEYQPRVDTVNDFS